MNKKADISISMVILGVIGVIVLAIVTAIVLDTTGQINTQRECGQAVDGTCRSGSCNSGEIEFSLSCANDDNGDICCADPGSRFREDAEGSS